MHVIRPTTVMPFTWLAERPSDVTCAPGSLASQPFSSGKQSNTRDPPVIPAAAEPVDAADADAEDLKQIADDLALNPASRGVFLKASQIC
jgi:hypothetical protein